MAKNESQLLTFVPEHTYTYIHDMDHFCITMTVHKKFGSIHERFQGPFLHSHTSKPFSRAARHEEQYGHCRTSGFVCWIEVQYTLQQSVVPLCLFVGEAERLLKVHNLALENKCLLCAACYYWPHKSHLLEYNNMTMGVVALTLSAPSCVHHP